jgi:anti-sigma regulatory factor (Ser/Thr protein kinase)
VRQQLTSPPAVAIAGATDVSLMLSHGIRSRHVQLAALPSAASWARRVLSDMLGEWRLEKMADPALLLLSELVTNAVQASGKGVGVGRQVITLTLRLTDTSLRMEVWDANPALPAPRKADLLSDHGRGLLLVDALGDAWGHRAADGGKMVWCEVAIPA